MSGILAGWQVDILCTHPMFGPDSGSGSWADLNLMFEKVRIGHGEGRRRRADLFLQVRCYDSLTVAVPQSP